MDYRTYWRW